MFYINRRYRLAVIAGALVAALLWLIYASYQNDARLTHDILVGLAGMVVGGAAIILTERSMW